MNNSLEELLYLHRLWLNENGGVKVDLSEQCLAGASLFGADLRYANMSHCDLRDVNLGRADLAGADLHSSSLTHANLCKCNLSYANLKGTRLNYANLDGAALEGTNMLGANVSGATGLIDPCNWMNSNFETNDKGWIVYKAFSYMYNPPPTWLVCSGQTIEEVVNPNRADECGCGINFGTFQWCTSNACGCILWECLIAWKDGPGIVVPYSTDGKARCGRMTLLRTITNGR